MIDFHTHIFPEKIVKKTLAILEANCETVPYTDGTAAGLQTSSEEAGIDCSVILPVATKPEQFDSINRFAIAVSWSGQITFVWRNPSGYGKCP